MKKKKMSPKSIIFYKLYLVNIVITVVFICMIAIICSAFSSRLILNNMIVFNEDMIEEKSSALDERVRQLDEAVNVMIGDENVFKFLMTNEAYYERPTALLRIIRHFQNICSNNSLIEGICLIDAKRGIAVTEKTKMRLVDLGPLPDYRKQNSFIINEDGDGTQLEFVKVFEPVRGEKDVYIILTINKDSFTNNLLIGSETEMVKSYLLTRDGDVLSVNGIDDIHPDIKIQLQDQVQSAEKINMDGQNLVLYKNRSQVSDISLAAVQDYTYLVKEAGAVKKIIIIASVLMIAAATFIIYLFSLYVYKPLKQLGHKLQGIAAKDQVEKVTNEYSLIENVVNELQTENEYALPSVVRDSIGKLVMEFFDEERFEHLKRVLHQNMNFEWNELVITECEDKEARLTIVNRFRELIQNESEIDGFFAGMTSNRCVGIFNTSFDYEEFLHKIDDVKVKLETDDMVKITCCVSRCFKNRENMNLVYSETLRTLDKTFFKGKNTLIYEAAPVSEYKNEYYSKEIENRLTKYVTEGRVEEAEETLHTLTKDLSNNATDIQYTRFVYFQICNNLIKNVLELGGKLPKEYSEKNIFHSVFSAESILDLEQNSEKMLHACIANFERREKPFSPNVEKAVSFIVSNYWKDLSLDDVAGAVFLSAGYLSIIFKEETGYTVLEYITYIRMQKAKELVLQTPALKVKEIAEQLGYNNVQSFIRYFKKYYGETPMAFRKKDG